MEGIAPAQTGLSPLRFSDAERLLGNGYGTRPLWNCQPELRPPPLQ